ncbi:uncharacterized protein EV420DRAFT_1331494 [Desarmillaria tabescens]|uniref:SEC7 domain-containing protein n=1 Tax=Armillaria tabescens TaxID=1929756 RepID=A0AA39N8T9_ARMTA|nr:uncharacterized protein EV420DRAFT_1331494 [Desarmillaria tabescens]KAK0461134.1 hypothetical protein EV420DRAFT_1331494 [Desarmillaria tabescens]
MSPSTAFSNGLQPVGPDMTASREKRVSRTDLDFEQALRAEGTFMLKEGLDVNALGVESPGPATRTFHSPRPPPKPTQPATPTIVPPTPSPVAGPSSSIRVVSPPSSSSLSSGDIFFDSNDVDHQVKRRSMYRSPGTSSSPDLATLLRKTKEKSGGTPNTQHKLEKRRECGPPLPDRGGNGRQRSSTALPPGQSSPTANSVKKNKLHRASPAESSSMDWIMAQMAGGSSPKPPKSSVRAKTSAFLGKVLGGTGTVRERSKTDASSPSSSSSLFQPLTPPVPPIPSEYQRSTPVGSPIADVFTSSPKESAPAPSPSPTSKPLPPIMGQPVDLDDDQSMVLVERVTQTPSPEKTQSKGTSFSKRRSMSVSDVELKRSVTAPPEQSPIPKTPETKRGTGADDPSYNGILNDFKGELSQLESTSNSLDLRDPSTPARRAAYLRSKTDGLVSSGRSETSTLTKHASLTAPTLTLQLDESEESKTNLLSPSPIVPPRTSSLQMPARSGIGPTSYNSPRGRGSSPLRGTPGSRGLRGMHRSTASSSEPSLIPDGDGTRIISRPPANSQQDLTVYDLSLSRYPSSSHSPARGDDPIDIESRAKDLASRCWHEDEDFLAKEKIAEWLGGIGRINKLALQNYVDFFNFAGLRLDIAFRQFCSKLYLKGETQQVDRILEEFSRRYWDCNPGGVYGSANIVHAVSYSLLLLNTDLHVADLTTRMSRNQFVRNTLTAVQTQLQPNTTAHESSPDLVNEDSNQSIRGASSEHTDKYRSKRSDSITSWNSVSRDTVLSSPAFSVASTQVTTPGESSNDINAQDVKLPTPITMYGRDWEADMESLLKEMYNAIKNNQILQPLSGRSSMSSLSPGSTMLRNRSLRGGQSDRLTTLKRGSIRGLQSILNHNGVSPYSSNSSIDGRVSPSPSFATSAHEGIYGSSSSFLQPTLGFAHNLSHTIIREAKEDDDRSIHSERSDSTTISISDEELALLGAPWAKEGMLCRKQYWESTGRRAKDKSWLDVFVVIQRGTLNMFTFGENGPAGSGVFGGGNWLASANPVGSVHLTHSLAHALPPPGYNRNRPYCMVLTLSDGGVYFFQAGTEELVNEWVSTCNYWAARTSKEPLAGGVSNMEYGWNRVTDPIHDRSHSDTESTKDDSMSVMSGRSSHSRFGAWRDGASTVRASRSPWTDRVYINEWKAPLPPTVSSEHDEETQMEALKKHVESMKKDLKKHNELREPMLALYQARSTSVVKAQSNWEKKSKYLLTEIVKYDLYIDSLQAAMSLRLKKRGEKALERALNGVEESGSKKWKRPEGTIQEDDEPSTPGPEYFTSKSHRRETAEGGAGDD